MLRNFFLSKKMIVTNNNNKLLSITADSIQVDVLSLQSVVTALSWAIPIAVALIGSNWCSAVSLHNEGELSGFCVIPNKNISVMSWNKRLRVGSIIILKMQG